MQLNEKQQVAVDAIMSGENVFLTGGGGRGKTYVIRYLESKGLDLVICAPTGQAALNAGGITAHSLFGLPIGLPSMDDWTKVGKKARNLFSGNNPPILVLDECFKGGVEVLTSEGFKRFDSLNKKEEIYQYDSLSGEIELVPPLRYVQKNYTGNLTKIKSAQGIDLTCTPNHEMLVYNRGVPSKVLAKDLKRCSMSHIKSGGVLKDSGGCLSDYEKLAIVYQADGSKGRVYTDNPTSRKALMSRFGLTMDYGNCTLAFTFKKARKISRFLEDFSHLEVTEQHNSREGYRTFTVRNVPKEYMIKDLSELFLLKDFDLSKAKEFLEYLQHWDGFQFQGGWGYSNTCKRSVDFVQTLSSMVGRRASISACKDDRSSSYSQCYKVHVSHTRGHITTQSITKTEEFYSGEVYCVTVPKGNILVRSNNKIHVVGNCGMTNALTLDIIDKKLQLATNSNKPFGGVQVVGSGDFLQLEPIIGQREKKYYYEQYNTPFAFGAKCWDFKTILFDVSERHPNKKHVRMLDSIRMKDYRHVKALELIQKGAKKYDLREEKLTLCCYNQDAENINSYHYNKIKESEVHYYGEFTGVPFKDNELLVDRDITLKVGAKVLIKANDPEGCYVNGDRGVVLSCGVDSVTVSLDRGGVVVIKPFTWDKFDFNKGIKGFSKVVVASFTQLPIKLGYAVSMHAAQGVTLDAVAIDIGKGCFSAGQAYMALSRIKNLDNISFVREVKPSDVIVHESAVKFYKNLSNVEGGGKC